MVFCMRRCWHCHRLLMHHHLASPVWPADYRRVRVRFASCNNRYSDLESHFSLCKHHIPFRTSFRRISIVVEWVQHSNASNGTCKLIIARETLNFFYHHCSKNEHEKLTSLHRQRIESIHFDGHFYHPKKVVHIFCMNKSHQKSFDCKYFGRCRPLYWSSICTFRAISSMYHNRNGNFASCKLWQHRDLDDNWSCMQNTRQPVCSAHLSIQEHKSYMHTHSDAWHSPDKNHRSNEKQ